jgi:hypothetical protein
MSLKGRDHLGVVRVYGEIILKWVSEKYGAKIWIHFKWHMIRLDGEN